MKATLIASFALVIGFAIGTTYGWWTGCVDGQILATESQTWILPFYAEHRGTNDYRVFDIAMDSMKMRLGTSLAVNNSLPPMAYFIQPKADGGLLDVAACWQLDHPSGTPTLFPPDSPSAKRLDEIRAKYKVYYDITLKRQTSEREKAKNQKQ